MTHLQCLLVHQFRQGALKMWHFSFRALYCPLVAVWIITKECGWNWVPIPVHVCWFLKSYVWVKFAVRGIWGLIPVIQTVVMNLSHLWVECKRSEVTAHWANAYKARADRSICIGSFSVSYALFAGGCSLNKQQKLKVICQSAAGVKTIRIERSCSRECICSKQMKEKIVCNKHLWEAEDRLQLLAFSLIYPWPLQCY